jgi:menaquinone-dependent protoporphyrinogen oxidase
MKILVAYASAHGSTGEVAEFIGRILQTYNVEVDVKDVTSVKRVTGYDAYVLGSAIDGGTWLQTMCQFVDQFSYQLAEKPSAFWINCIRALEPDGYQHALKYYFDHKTLETFNLRSTAVFTGKLKLDAINQQEQWYLASHYDGKQPPILNKTDFRDWEAIATWANKLAKDLNLEPTFDTKVSTN